MHGNLTEAFDQQAETAIELACHDAWQIAFSKPCRQKAAKTNLEAKGFECWYPLRKVVKTRPARTISSKTRHRRRFETVDKIEPALGSYLFIRQLWNGHDGPLYEIDGVGGYCKFGERIATMSDLQIELLRLAEADGYFNLYDLTVPGIYRVSHSADPCTLWTGQTRLMKRLDESAGPLLKEDQFRRVIRYIQQSRPPANP